MPGRNSGRLRSRKRKSSTEGGGEESPTGGATSSVNADSNINSHPGDGSFVLEVANRRIRIPQERAKILRSNSQFFEHAFCHGTTEASLGVLSKPDWTLETAELILQLLEGNIPLPEDLSLLQQLQVAADQILLPFTIPHPVYSTEIDLQKKPKILELVQETRQRCTQSFIFRRCDLTHMTGDDEDSQASSDGNHSDDDDSDDNSRTRLFARKGRGGRVDIWLQYLKQGILFTNADKGLRVELSRKEGEDHSQDIMEEDRKNYLVQYSSPLYVTIHHVCTGLRQMREFDSDSSDDDTLDPFRMVFQIYCGFYDHCVDLTEDLDVRWEGDFNVDGVADDVTVTGPLEDLSAVLVHVQDFIIPCKNVQKIATFFHEPDWKTLGRLIHATQQCKDNPNTLLWDSEAGDFFTMKTLKDTKIILGFMSRESSPMAKNGTFELTEKQGDVVSKLGNNWETR